MGRGGKAAEAGRKISVAELKKHSKPENAWVAINGKVYDVSNWNAHPGGRVVYTAAGGDATDSFRAFHSGAAHAMLEDHLIGELDGKILELSAFEKEYRELIAKLRAQGLFNASMPYYAWKVASTTAILALAVYVTLSFESFGMKMVGALLVALFWQQSGWLAHDFAHHQVFKARWLNDIVVLVVGDLYQGFSLEWWKSKHNTHHAIPNLHESVADAHDGDPDIDTMPFLAWSVDMAKKHAATGAKGGGLMVRNQALLYFPILFFARLTWAMQSFAYVFRLESMYWGAASPTAGLVTDAKVAATQPGVTLHYEVAERAMLILHYAWVFGLAFFGCNTLLQAVAFVLAAETAGGWLLALAFGVGHNGMRVYDADKRPGFAELQVTTTRNVEDVWLNGWFMGGLHYQIEHHLFPMMPRHNLRYARAAIEPLCRKHGIEYRSMGLLAGNAEVLSVLGDITAAVKDFPAV